MVLKTSRISRKSSSGTALPARSKVAGQFVLLALSSTSAASSSNLKRGMMWCNHRPASNSTRRRKEAGLHLETPLLGSCREPGDTEGYRVVFRACRSCGGCLRNRRRGSRRRGVVLPMRNGEEHCATCLKLYMRTKEAHTRENWFRTGASKM